MSPKFTLDVFPSATIAPVSPFIYSGFIEHLGRCIYGGILPANPTNFPYSSRKPCPPDQFVETPAELVTPEGFRKDVIECIRDELKVPMMRWPGGNYVSSYHWEDGIGPRSERKRRPELAWGGEEPNLFGTDEFVKWCRVANCEPYICLNMGTGTLIEALNWVEYCNGTGDTYYANLRRRHTGKGEPHCIKYWGLGNEVWGAWQVGQMTASQYASVSRQWAHALKLLDPSIILVSCGETGLNEWDNIVLNNVIDKADLHSIHLYTSFGERDRSSREKEYNRTVYGPEAAEQSIEVANGLIAKARIANGVTKEFKIAFDEWGVWDEIVGTPQNGLEQVYTLKDALAFASWLNVFIRQSSTVSIACLAQSVNVISPLITSATGVLRHPPYHVFRLYSEYMRDGVAVRVTLGGTDVHGAGIPRYDGETLPGWISTIRGRPSVLDASAVFHSAASGKRSLRVAVVNRNLNENYDMPVRIAFENVAKNSSKGFEAQVEVHEVWHEDVEAKNGWGSAKGNDSPFDNVSVKTWHQPWNGNYSFKAHSFTLLVFEVE